MKSTAITSVTQVACLVLLAVLVFEDDGAGSMGANENPSHAGAAVAEKPAAITGGMEEAQLRRIIREELAVALRDRDEHRVKDAAAQRRSPEDNHYQREYVSQQIDYYASVGSIDEQEMHELQREIAELDEAGRKEMLSKLTRAMNARQIKGQL